MVMGVNTVSGGSEECSDRGHVPLWGEGRDLRQEPAEHPALSLGSKEHEL